MGPLEHGGLRRLDDVVRGRLTPGGRLVGAVCAVALFLSIGSIAAPLVMVAAAALALLVAGIIAGMPLRPRLRVVRHLPPVATAGDEIAYRVTVTSEARRPLPGLCVEERDLPAQLRPVGEAVVVGSLAPGESREVTLRLRALHRGRWRLDRLQAASAHPSGLVKWGAHDRHGSTMTVLPRPAVVRLPSLSSSGGSGAVQAGSRPAIPADRGEWDGLREWAFGDRTRDLHAPSMARTGRPMVRRRRQESTRHFAVLLDGEVSGPGHSRRWERALSVTSGVVSSLAQHGAVSLLTVASPMASADMAGPGGDATPLLRLLAEAEPGRVDGSEPVRWLLARSPLPQLAFVVLSGWDATRLRRVNELRSAGVALKVAVMGARQLPSDLPADEWWQP